MSETHPIPSTLRIGHLTYAVTRDDEHLDRESVTNRTPKYAGLSNSAEQRITIRTALADDYEAETLLHEVLHSCLRVSGVDPDNDAAARLEDVEERAVAAIAGPLLATLRDNPELVDYLLRRTGAFDISS